MKKTKFSWKWMHRWLGLPLCIFMLLFCVSGILLNHREAIRSWSVSRSLLPSDYSIEDYNNGCIKGTVKLGSDSVLAYGYNGIWLTDGRFSSFSDFNKGLPSGGENRSIKNLLRHSDGSLWSVSQYGVYRHDGVKWEMIFEVPKHERFSDIAFNADSTQIVVASRSGLYNLDPESIAVRQINLPAPVGYENKVSMFKTFWNLHSGELFGLTGRIIVDIVAIILIFLSLTGIVLFVLPGIIRRSMVQKRKRYAWFLRWNFEWHNRVGYITLIVTILITATGMCLRPPFMIPLVMTRTAPVPFSAMDSDNAWHDKLRCIRWDNSIKKWILSTSEGFYETANPETEAPRKMDTSKVPLVSPMSINVWERCDSATWLVGSFSGLYEWNPSSGLVSDRFTGRDPERSGGRSLSNHLICGYSSPKVTEREHVFDYSNGAEGLPDTPELLKKQPLSLWNFALELHVGRCYTPFLGPLSSLFVFFAGAISLIVLISGLLLNRRMDKKK